MMQVRIMRIIGLVLGIMNSVLCIPAFQVNLCETPECIEAASNIRKAMNESVSPCDDFYQFSCGNYQREKSIPDLADSFHQIQKKLESFIIEEPLKRYPKHFLLPNIYYKACMNATVIERLGGKPMVEISDSIGGWPVVKGENWNSNGSFRWQETSMKLFKFGFQSFSIIRFGIGSFSSNELLYIGPEFSALPYEFLMKGFDNTNVQAYYKYMVDLAVEFGANKSLAEKEMIEYLQFVIDLAKVSNLQSKELRLMTIEEIQGTYPYADWLPYFNALVPENVKLTEKDRIRVYVPKFFEKLGELLRKTSDRTLANYLLGRAHQEASRYLSENFSKLNLEYGRDYLGIWSQEKIPRPVKCVDETKFYFINSLESLYAQKYFNLNIKKAATEIFENIRNAFHHILSEVQRMDEETKKDALEKLDKMKALIAFPDEYFVNEKLAEFYQGLKISVDEYFKSYLEMEVFLRNNNFNNIWLMGNGTDWFGNQYLNFYVSYEPWQNSLEIPASILQGKYFHPNRPKYLNYGVFGTSAGIEVMQGLNELGRMRDAESNPKKWWGKVTKREDNHEINCFSQKYGQNPGKNQDFKWDGMSPYESYSAHEAGMKMAYLAYKQWATTNQQEPKLPGLNFTTEQMFWIATAQNYCMKLSKEKVISSGAGDLQNYSAHELLTVLENMRNFSEDFNCPLNSPMNPAEKCEMW